MSNFSIEEIIINNNLKYIDGVWYSKDQEELSYPDEGYNACYNIEDNSFWFKHRNDCIVEAIKNSLPNNTIFDVGGGNGYVSLGLMNEGMQTVLIEPGVQGVLNAKKRGLKNIICATLEKGIKKKKLLPSIGLFDVLEHINDDDQFLFSLTNYLKDEGLLYLTVPAYNALWSYEDDNAGHYRRYTLEVLKQKLKNSGYSIEYATYFFSFLPIPIFIFRKLPSMLKLKRKAQQASKEHDSNSTISLLLDKIWKMEIMCIKKRKSIPFGGSCLIVARKNCNK